MWGVYIISCMLCTFKLFRMKLFRGCFLFYLFLNWCCIEKQFWIFFVIWNNIQLIFFIFFVAGAEVIALNIFTAQTNNILSEYTEVHYGWSYISGWVAFAIATVCVGSILASVYNRRPMLSPYSIEVPYNQFDVSNSTTKVY